jgi:hypothetical protein
VNNLEIFIYLPNILVTVELYDLRVSVTSKEHGKDRRASAPQFSIEIAPLSFSIHYISGVVRNLVALDQRFPTFFDSRHSLLFYKNVEAPFSLCPILYSRGGEPVARVPKMTR